MHSVRDCRGQGPPEIGRLPERARPRSPEPVDGCRCSHPAAGRRWRVHGCDGRPRTPPMVRSRRPLHDCTDRRDGTVTAPPPAPMRRARSARFPTGDVCRAGRGAAHCPAPRWSCIVPPLVFSASSGRVRGGGGRDVLPSRCVRSVTVAPSRVVCRRGHEESTPRRRHSFPFSSEVPRRGPRSACVADPAASHARRCPSWCATRRRCAARVPRRHVRPDRSSPLLP